MSERIQSPSAPKSSILLLNDCLPMQNSHTNEPHCRGAETPEKDEICTTLLDISPDLLRWEHVACDLCGEDDPAFLFVKDEFHYVRCRRCGLVYVTPRLRDHLQQQERFYELVTEGNTEAAAERDRHPRRMKSLTKVARSYMNYKRIGHLLDVGCGFGTFLEVAESLDWRACGLEVASAPASVAGRHHDVFYGFLSDAPYEPNSFDVVRLNDVIEHVPSPRALVRDIERILRPGGLLYISTPNVDSFSVALQHQRWRYVRGQDHLYLFDLRTLRHLLEVEGFKVVKVSTRGIRLTDQDRRSGTQPLFLRKLTRRTLTCLERTLDVAVRITSRGHRLRVWAEKAV